MNSPDFDPEADSQIPALSKMLVTLQGSLQMRRAYLAGVLRNRLKTSTHTGSISRWWRQWPAEWISSR